MAGRPCSVCQHLDRLAIDQAMVNHKPFRAISRQFDVSKDAVLRHHDDHLPEALTKAKDAVEATNADDLLAQLRALRTKSLQLMMAAEKSGDLRCALAGIRETRATLELLLELEQRIDRRPVVNLVASAEWLSVRAIVLDVLRDDPNRRMALAERLASLEAPA